MQRMEDFNFRQLWRLTQASEGALTHTNKKMKVDPRKLLKTQGRMTLCPPKKSDFVCEIAEIYANCTTFSRFLMTFSRICVQKTRPSRFLQIYPLPFILYPSSFTLHPLPFHPGSGGRGTHPDLPINARENLRGARPVC